MIYLVKYCLEITSSTLNEGCTMELGDCGVIRSKSK